MLCSVTLYDEAVRTEELIIIIVRQLARETSDVAVKYFKWNISNEIFHLQQYF